MSDRPRRKASKVKDFAKFNAVGFTNSNDDSDVNTSASSSLEDETFPEFQDEETSEGAPDNTMADVHENSHEETPDSEVKDDYEQEHESGEEDGGQDLELEEAIKMSDEELQKWYETLEAENTQLKEWIV